MLPMRLSTRDLTWGSWCWSILLMSSKGSIPSMCSYTSRECLAIWDSKLMLSIRAAEPYWPCLRRWKREKRPIPLAWMNWETKERAERSRESVLSKARRWRIKVMTEPTVSGLRWWVKAITLGSNWASWTILTIVGSFSASPKYTRNIFMRLPNIVVTHT